jgi:hypothetical protein
MPPPCTDITGRAVFRLSNMPCPLQPSHPHLNRSGAKPAFNTHELFQGQVRFGAWEWSCVLETGSTPGCLICRDAAHEQLSASAISEHPIYLVGARGSAL